MNISTEKLTKNFISSVATPVNFEEWWDPNNHFIANSLLSVSVSERSVEIG